MRNVTRLVVLTAICLGVTVASFVAGFGTGYIVADTDGLRAVLAPTPVSSPAPAPTTTSADGDGGENAAAEPQPTPLPIPVPATTPQTEDEQAFAIFWEAWRLVQEHYYGDLPGMRDVSYAAIRGMLSTLDDDYTAFIEPNFAAVLSEDATGEFEGIGAFVGMDENGDLEIVSPFEGGPASKAGLQPGDRVLAVDGEPLAGRTLYESISLIRGPAATDVVLLVQRDGVPEAFEVIVTRARLEIPITEVKMLEEQVGYIRLFEFSATASQLVEDGLLDLLGQEPTGIILDLRQNPGGWLDQSVEVADLFLDDGVVLFERWSDGRERVFESRAGGVAEVVPLVVLVDRGSASASEIVAGAVQDRGRAILVGEATFGKGSVQQPFSLSDGSELRVTIARWFTPGDRAIHGEGLRPDIEVAAPAEDDADPSTDPQLDRAIDYILKGE